MLSDPRIKAYYAYIIRYWTDFYNKSQTNIEQGFVTSVMSELGRIQNLEDSESNRELFAKENASQSIFQSVYQKFYAGLASHKELDDAQSAFKFAKESRIAVIPNCIPLSVSIEQIASGLLDRSLKQLDRDGDANSEQAVIVSHGIVEAATQFSKDIKSWLEIQNSRERNNEYAGNNTESPESSYKELGYIYDGNYGDEINRISPEGFVYGSRTFIQQVIHNFWWNGAKWLEIGEDIGQSNSVQLLPSTPQEPDTVWRCLDRYEEDTARYVWKYFFWDAESQSWQPILWQWTVDSVQELPNNPWFRGQAHEVKEPDVQAMWDGYVWRRIRISSLEDDLGIISTLDMYGGTLRGLSPEVELVYINPTELTLKPIDSDFEYVTVNEVVVDSSKRTSVYSFSPVLNWFDETESFAMSLMQHSTNTINQEYWVYLANRDDVFNMVTYDYRGKLFCSETTPTNNRLGKVGTSAYNAVLIGKCQTAIPENESDRVEFLYELDVSLISRTSDLKETFREFSDYDLVYVDENTLRLKRNYGTTGQIFIAGSLYYIGTDLTLSITDTRITCDESSEIDFDTSAIVSNTLYYVYMASNSDIWNNNELNAEYNRPWHPEDEGAGDGAEGPYYLSKDLRLKMFLSTKTPDDGRLTETWRGYWTRHVGQVRTDGVGKFIYSASISAIRQATLNPTFFDGLAEISIDHVDQSSFRIVRKRGTSGILMVNGSPVQAYNADEVDSVHTVTINDAVYFYDEETQNVPLIDSGDTVSDYASNEVQLYIANNRADIWGDLSGRHFFCTTTPKAGYLDSNFKGNNARWIACIKPSAINRGTDLVTNGVFVGSSGWQGAGWVISPTTQDATHILGNTTSLSQTSMSVTPGAIYEVYITVKSMSAGAITLSIGGTTGSPIVSSGTTRQLIRATNSSPLSISPSLNADLTVDNIKCYRITAAGFTASYLIDSIFSSNVSIDDENVSSSHTWTSQRISFEINRVFSESSNLAAFNRQKDIGLGIKLYLSAPNTLHLISMIGPTQIVCGEDLSVFSISDTGTFAQVTGSPSTFYYVYLGSSGLSLSTIPPNKIYTKTSTLDDSKILVGYAGFANNGTMVFEGCVFSQYNQPQKTWSIPVAGEGNFVLNSAGMVIPKDGLSTISIIGSNLIRLFARTDRTNFSFDFTPGLGIQYIATEQHVYFGAYGSWTSEGWSYDNGWYPSPFVTGNSILNTNYGIDFSRNVYSEDIVLTRAFNILPSTAETQNLYLWGEFRGGFVNVTRYEFMSAFTVSLTVRGSWI